MKAGGTKICHQNKFIGKLEINISAIDMRLTAAKYKYFGVCV
jgi:hypothetical protein